MGAWGGRGAGAAGSLGRMEAWGGWESGADRSLGRMGAWGGRGAGAEGSLGRMEAWGGWESGADRSLGRRGAWGGRESGMPCHSYSDRLPRPCDSRAIRQGRADSAAWDVQRESRADAVGMAHYGTRGHSGLLGGADLPLLLCAELLEPATAASAQSSSSSRCGAHRQAECEPTRPGQCRAGGRHQPQSRAQSSAFNANPGAAARPIRAHAPASVGGAPAVTPCAQPHGLLL